MLASLNSKIFRMQTRSSEGGDPLIYIYIYIEREREREGGGSERGGFMMSGKFLEEFDHKVLQDFREQLLGVLG
jgi:hypothetical protein